MLHDYVPAFEEDYDPSQNGIPHDDPFWGDPDYQVLLRLKTDEGEVKHAVMISEVGDVHLVWVCENRCLTVMTIEIPDAMKPDYDFDFLLPDIEEL